MVVVPLHSKKFPPSFSKKKILGFLREMWHSRTLNHGGYAKTQSISRKVWHIVVFQTSHTSRKTCEFPNHSSDVMWHSIVRPWLIWEHLPVQKHEQKSYECTTVHLQSSQITCAKLIWTLESLHETQDGSTHNIKPDLTSFKMENEFVWHFYPI